MTVETLLAKFNLTLSCYALKLQWSVIAPCVFGMLKQSTALNLRTKRKK